MWKTSTYRWHRKHEKWSKERKRIFPVCLKIIFKAPRINSIIKYKEASYFEVAFLRKVSVKTSVTFKQFRESRKLEAWTSFAGAFTYLFVFLPTSLQQEATFCHKQWWFSFRALLHRTRTMLQLSNSLQRECQLSVEKHKPRNILATPDGYDTKKSQWRTNKTQ